MIDSSELAWATREKNKETKQKQVAGRLRAEGEQGKDRLHPQWECEKGGS